MCVCVKPYGCGSQNRFGIPFWLVPPMERTDFSGWIESEVHWGYDLDFDPWPYVDGRHE